MKEVVYALISTFSELTYSKTSKKEMKSITELQRNGIKNKPIKKSKSGNLNDQKTNNKEQQKKMQIFTIELLGKPKLLRIFNTK